MARRKTGLTRRSAMGLGAAATAAMMTSPTRAATIQTGSAGQASARIYTTVSDAIFDVIEEHMGVSRQEIFSPYRTPRIVKARQTGMYLAYQLSGRSLPEIGYRFGRRDHTTVLHAVRKIERQRREDPDVLAETDLLTVRVIMAMGRNHPKLRTRD